MSAGTIGRINRCIIDRFGGRARRTAASPALRACGLGHAACLNFILVAALASTLSVTLAGCLVQKREKIAVAPLSQPLKTATLEELLEKIQKQQDAIQTIDATVELEPSVTSQAKGEITTYHDVRAFLLIRKPGFLRMIGQYPVVRNTAFDLVSDGERFGLYIPSKNRYIMGDSRGGKRSQSPLENLRPQHVLDALLWKGPEPGSEEAALDVSTDGSKSYYVVLILRRSGEGKLQIARKLWFERADLSLERLQIYENGVVGTDAHYSSYADSAGISFPRKVVFNRPQDDYGLMLSVTQMKFNEPLPDDKFQMERPAGAEVVDLEKAPS